MKEYFHNRNVLIAILFGLFCLSWVDVILRASVFQDVASTTPNYGEALVTAVLSILLIVFALKGKDRIFYILCGGWLAYFVLNHLFGLPSLVGDLFTVINGIEGSVALLDIASIIAILIQLLVVVGIVVLGGLLVEYMNDGTIYSRAFNLFCASVVVLIVLHTLMGVILLFSGVSLDMILVILNNLARLAMLFLFTYFAYDSAKTQLSKTEL